MKNTNKHHITTQILHEENEIISTPGTVNPPVHHASTILFNTLEELENHNAKKLKPGTCTYAIHGTSIHFALAQAITKLENGHDTILSSSGLSAICLALGALLKSGDHLLMTDSVYGPTREFCDFVLTKQNIEVSYFDPRAGTDIEHLIKHNTAVIFLESPASYTLEIHDTLAVTQIAKTNNIITVCDNTWATPLYHQPLSLGIDVVIHAATKYICGHADAMLGSITANEKTYQSIHRHAGLIGNHAAPDDCYLVLRGLRTLPQRLKQHESTAYKLAEWLASRDEVKSIIHPGLIDHPDHQLWKRDFTGASGLFGIILKPFSKQALTNMLDNMALFGLGFSWGGYESLLIPAYLNKYRTINRPDEKQTLLRIHAGLEHIDDLIADLDAGFCRLRNTKQ